MDVRVSYMGDPMPLTDDVINRLRGMIQSGELRRAPGRPRAPARVADGRFPQRRPLDGEGTGRCPRA
jgi:hypothetical protein